MSERDDDVTLPSGREDVYLERLNHHDNDGCPAVQGEKTHLSFPSSVLEATSRKGSFSMAGAVTKRVEPLRSDSTAALQSEVYEWNDDADEAVNQMMIAASGHFPAQPTDRTALVQKTSVENRNTTALLQSEVFQWCETTFAGQTLAGKLQHLWEELHEVFAHCYQDKQLEEIADCALLTLEVASLSKVTLARPAKFDVAIDDFNPAEDFETSVRERFEVVRQRKWQPADAQGVFHHVKES
jgi:hypothetical protein